MKARLVCLLFVLLALVFPTAAARADGIIIIDPPICDPAPCPPQPFPVAQLTVRYHHVTVTIQDQVAVTHVDQVFYNPNNWQVEGVYMFPIPPDAAVSAFTLWVDGQPVQGEVLDANQARQAYEEIVRRTLDPALLEYAGRGALRARIFPIPPLGERRIELEYTQVLAADNGLVEYVYPLNTEKFSLQPLGSVSVSVDVRSGTPIRAVYSPSHAVGVFRENETHVTVGYEAQNVKPNQDFTLYYSLGNEAAFHLLSYRDPSDERDPDGFFLLLLAPKPEAAQQAQPKDLLLVLDRSGSMEGEKFIQAQSALRYILQHLNPEDRFNIITFSTGIETYKNSLRPAEEANEALAWVDRLSALGSTDINRALLEAAALADRERPTYVIFLTDGLPTEGEVDPQKINSNFQAVAPQALRLFTFGVGYDVDTLLLDTLAQDHHGASFYVVPGERLDEALSTFYAKISTPVLTDLQLDFGGLSVSDIYPSPLPDLFVGSEVVIVGRYRDGGSTTLTLRGQLNGQPQTFTYSNQVFTQVSPAASNDPLANLPRLWATRKIGYLLNQIRLSGPNQETIDQIVRLSIRYGIITPYTSYLVTEPAPLGASAQERIAEEQYDAAAGAPAAPSSGQDAVEKSQGMGGMAGAGSASAPPEEAANVVRIVGARTFLYSNGVWIDTGFDPETMQTVKVAFLSDDYFALSAARPDLAAAFALGSRVIALADGVAYEVVAAGAATGPLVIPPTYTPGPASTRPATPIALYPGQPTPVPAQPTAAPSQPGSGGSLPCVGALLPLVICLLWLLLRRK
jgi:Ca-activated chloride channel family protein